MANSELRLGRWVNLMQRLLTMMNTLVSFGLLEAQMQKRFTVQSLAMISQLCSNLGYTVPQFPPPIVDLQTPMLPPPIAMNKQNVYRRRARVRDLCPHFGLGDPYTVHRQVWIVCRDCDRRWRTDTANGWVVDDKDDPDRQRVSRSISSSPVVPHTGMCYSKVVCSETVVFTVVQ